MEVVMAKKIIKIKDRRGNVDTDLCHLSKGEDDEAQWVAEDGRFTVRFADSPFQDSVFVVPEGGSVRSGPPVNGTVGETYKYKVDGPEGDIDPRIVITR